METQSAYIEKKKEVCDVVDGLFGPFHGNFINAGENRAQSIRDTIGKLTGMNCNDVERYIYVSEINGITLIKK
jgi:hypothetical protein